MSTPTPSAYIPKLLCPFKPAIHPRIDQVERASIERWARRMDLRPEDRGYARLENAHFAILAGRCHPTASLEALNLIVDYYIWLFLWDDLFDLRRDGELVKPEEVRWHTHRAIEVFKGGKAPLGDPLLEALEDVLQRLEARLGSAWLERFAEHHRAYFEATVQESIICNSGRLPDVATYKRLRRDASGVFMVEDMIELAEEVRLSERVWTHPLIEQLMATTVNIVAWANDLFSLGYELRDGNGFNLILCLMQERGVTMEEGIELAAQMHDSEVRNFLQLTQQLPSFGEEDEALKRFVNGQKLWIRANVDWSALTERYRVPLPIQAPLAECAALGEALRRYT